jgi:hypothetical protein
MLNGKEIQIGVKYVDHEGTVIVFYEYRPDREYPWVSEDRSYTDNGIYYITGAYPEFNLVGEYVVPVPVAVTPEKTKQFTIVYPEGTPTCIEEAFEVILKEFNEGRMVGLYLPVGFMFKEVQEPVPVLLNDKELECILRVLGAMTDRDSRVLVGESDLVYLLWVKVRDNLRERGVDTSDMGWDSRVEVIIKQDNED